MKVFNRRKFAPPDAVYVGRPTKWGNPYEIGAVFAGKVLTREDCVFLFRAYAERKLKTEPHWLDELKGKNLVCWCKPLNCHADVLMELANK